MWFKDEITYCVTLKPRKISQGRYDFEEIVWSDRNHYVRIPLAVCVNITDGVITGSTVSHSDAEYDSARGDSGDSSLAVTVQDEVAGPSRLACNSRGHPTSR
ncbi:hypothetical protein CRG98_019418 [Punica granatum]|uniref:Uncharacterized protein n=1 Tax=Punica granatum TaxID=22663 RepID=A0A2I0JWH4_PUNGR|nr:hypothetical protein CRG98_019418 [Punica granatum]